MWKATQLQDCGVTGFAERWWEGRRRGKVLHLGYKISTK